jgi:hypothetical protein
MEKYHASLSALEDAAKYHRLSSVTTINRYDHPFGGLFVPCSSLSTLKKNQKTTIPSVNSVSKVPGTFKRGNKVL